MESVHTFDILCEKFWVLDLPLFQKICLKYYLTVSQFESFKQCK